MKKSNITKKTKKNGDVAYTIAFMYKNMRFKRTFSTKKACEAWEREVKNQVDKTGFYSECSKTLSDMIDEWWKLDSDALAPNTKQYYKSTIRKIKNHKISKMIINQISYADLQKFFNDLAKEGNNKGTCINVKKTLSHAFKLAITNQYIQFNPLAYVKNKGKETKDSDAKQTITPEEFDSLTSYFLDKGTFVSKSIVVLLYIGAYTGARITEALAVEWDDVDFTNNTITLDKKLERLEKVATTRMKTKGSKATLPLPDPLKQVLLEWRNENGHTLICCNSAGKYLNQDVTALKFRTAGEKLGFRFHFHMLRHGYGSLLVANGVNIKVVQKLMRHSNITTTMNTYVHTDQQAQRDAINNVFNVNYPKITPKGGDVIQRN